MQNKQIWKLVANLWERMLNVNTLVKGVKGVLLVVDKKKGATLRSECSIDDSEELGRLRDGVSLDFDAVR